MPTKGSRSKGEASSAPSSTSTRTEKAIATRVKRMSASARLRWLRNQAVDQLLVAQGGKSAVAAEKLLGRVRQLDEAIEADEERQRQLAIARGDGETEEAFLARLQKQAEGSPDAHLEVAVRVYLARHRHLALVPKTEPPAGG